MRERERHVEEVNRIVFCLLKKKIQFFVLQTMRIMGLNSAVNFISWLISSYIPMIIVSIVVAS